MRSATVSPWLNFDWKPKPLPRLSAGPHQHSSSRGKREGKQGRVNRSKQFERPCRDSNALFSPPSYRDLLMTIGRVAAALLEAEQDNRGGTPSTDFLAMVGRLAGPHGGEA
jgi:hypothetical protein